MDTAALKRFAQQARVILKDGVKARLKYWGFDNKGNIIDEPISVDGGVIFRGEVINDSTLFDKWRVLKDFIKTHGVEHAAEEAAYTWFNRLMAIRILAKNGYISPQLEFESVRAKTPLIVANARRGQLPKLTNNERSHLDELLEDDSAETEQFALLISAFCRTNKLLRRVFGRLHDFTELLLPQNILAENGFISLLNDNGFITEEDYREVELIGWLYQFYISERKDEVFKSFKNKKKAEAEDIPAATQIFTPNWIVKYMVQNTVGRIWLDLNPESKIKGELDYLVENPDATDEKPLVSDVLEIKLLDPACGSGHILVEGFDLLFAIYTEEGYSKRNAIREILSRNLYGLDIDLRAAQLANFALLLKAAAQDPSIIEDDITPNVYAMPEPYSFSGETIRTFLGDNLQYTETLQETLTLMQQSQNLGSIIKFEISPEMRETLQTRLTYWEKRLTTINDIFLQDEFTYLLTYLRIILLLTQQYEAVAANPPYMGSGNMNAELKEYANKNYPKSKSDLFAIFMEAGMQLCSDNGRMGMINMHSWMFLSSFEALRKEIIENYFIENMLHLGARTFDELSGEVVQNTAFVLKNTQDIGYGVYYRLVDGRNCREKEQMFLNNENRFAHISQSNFEKIPGSPIAYWVSEKEKQQYQNGLILSQFTSPRKGIDTGENAVFLRLWQEISIKTISIHNYNFEKKWFPYNKGGGFRKWYGYREYVVNWKNHGEEIKMRLKWSSRKPTIRNESYFFKEGFAWSTISSNGFSARYTPAGALFDNGGCTLFADNNLLYYGGLTNSCVAARYLEFLSPTLNFQPGNIGRIICINNNMMIEPIEHLTQQNISISRRDWDSRETSWDFQKNELIRQEQPTIEAAYQTYLQFWTEQFQQLHSNEVELNRIFIDIYGLQEELTPDVKLKDITIMQEELDYPILGELTEMEQLPNLEQLPIKADEVMRQFISYAVGCFMGRYRLNQPRLHIAHPNPSSEEVEPYQYNGNTFHIDDDAIIPLMDSSCGFADNALLRLKEFVRMIWGHDTEIDNINFIESKLRKDLESYLIKDFWKDHLRRYQKRPIYWLFASPKGAFQVLVYMHRMNKYTVEKIRSNYLLKYIQTLETRRQMLDADSANLDRNGQRTLEKIIKDLDECRTYDLLLKNVADNQITFDLDDGVLVNHAKFFSVAAPIK